jgi:predicted SprT family Zn-dependent metalloprotease
MSVVKPDLNTLFEKVNEEHFDAFLDAPVLKWNARLRSSAGRFIPGSRRFFRSAPPVIEVATYLCDEKESEALIRDTLAHEMIHYWLWIRKKPYGHTAEFWMKMTQMGVSRYNPVPRTRPYRYVYRCPGCESQFPARKKLGVLACGKCCKTHSQGRFDVRFRLFLERVLKPGESFQSSLKSL